jgi:hypothetical protein
MLPSLLSKPQQKFLLTLFSTILVVYGKVNFTNLSRYSQISERSYRRQFERSCNFIQGNADLIKQAIAASARQKRKVRLAYLLNCREPKRVSRVLLFSTDIHLDTSDILDFYKARF